MDNMDEQVSFAYQGHLNKLQGNGGIGRRNREGTLDVTFVDAPVEGKVFQFLTLDKDEKWRWITTSTVQSVYIHQESKGWTFKTTNSTYQVYVTGPR